MLVRSRPSGRRPRRRHRYQVVAVATAALTIACGAGAAVPASASTGTPSPGPPDIVTAPTLIARTTAGDVGYREVGTGSPVLLIMGFGGSMDDWAPSFVDALAAHHTVIVLRHGRPGAGGAPPASGEPADPSGHPSRYWRVASDTPSRRGRSGQLEPGDCAVGAFPCAEGFSRSR